MQDTGMSSIADMIRSILQANPSMVDSYEQAINDMKTMTPQERMQRKIDRYNASVGNLDTEDGYNCEICKNKGHVAKMRESKGAYYDTYPLCKCMEIRKSIHRMKRSGLEKIIRDKRLDNFVCSEDWQSEMLDIAKRYIENGVSAGDWMFFGGAVGCGKTHICTATARELLYKIPVYYMMWPEVNGKLKMAANDAEEYDKIISPLKNIDLLYIDDLFKPASTASGVPEPPTPADIRRTYEIINFRYINKMPTIISSERLSIEIADIDEAVGTRIIEKSKKGYCMNITRGRDRNYRLK